MTLNYKIRDWEIKDLDLYKKWNTGLHNWMKTNGPYYPRMTNEEVDETIRYRSKKIASNSFDFPRKSMAIVDAENNKLIGSVSWYWQCKYTNWVSAGIVIYDEKYWGKGVGYSALGQWSDYLFENMDTIVRLDLRTYSANIGMMKLALKLGYQEEARFRKARIVDGKFFDSIGYGILRSEWENLYPNGFKSTL